MGKVISVDEDRLREIVAEVVNERFEASLADVEEVRRSPAVAVVRLEDKLDHFIQENTREHENLATKGDLAAVRGELDRLIQENTKEHENLATKGDLAAVRGELD
ncbi:MAG: hypothetical protein ACUVXI_07915, partial [bacterium]